MGVQTVMLWGRMGCGQGSGVAASGGSISSGVSNGRDCESMRVKIQNVCPFDIRYRMLQYGEMMDRPSHFKGVFQGEE